jgi:hypothetical protein
MDVPEAIALVEGMAFHPDVTLSAVDLTDRYQDTIDVHMSLRAKNSNRDKAPDYIDDVPGGARSAWAVYVSDITDPAPLVYRVVLAAVEAFTHEIREFARLAGTWQAPLHPHRRAGILAWASYAGTDPAADYVFGE